MGRHDEAIRAAQEALNVEPVSLSANSHVGLALYRARQYDAAIERFKETLHLDPDFADAHVMLGVTLVQTGMYGEAVAAFNGPVRSRAKTLRFWVCLAMASGWPA